MTAVLEEVGISNGLAWSADGKTMYYIDTPRHLVDAFDVDLATGALSNRRVIAEFADSSPDGMAIDVEGCLWVACWGGKRVERIDPSNGERLAIVRCPGVEHLECRLRRAQPRRPLHHHCSRGADRRPTRHGAARWRSVRRSSRG